MILLLDTRNNQHFVGANRKELLIDLRDSGRVTINYSKVPVSFGGQPSTSHLVVAVINGNRLEFSYSDEFTLDEVVSESNKDLLVVLCRGYGFKLFQASGH